MSADTAIRPASPPTVRGEITVGATRHTRAAASTGRNTPVTGTAMRAPSGSTTVSASPTPTPRAAATCSESPTSTGSGSSLGAASGSIVVAGGPPATQVTAPVAGSVTSYVPRPTRPSAR